MVCGGVYRSGQHEPFTRKNRMLQLQLCCKDRRRWQEDRGKAVRERKRKMEMERKGKKDRL